MSYQPRNEKWRQFENIQPSYVKGLPVAHSPYDIYYIKGGLILSFWLSLAMTMRYKQGC